MHRYLRALVSFLALGHPPAVALEFQQERIRVHGFASQAAVNTNANQYYGARRGTALDFTEIGVNASVQLDPDLLLSGQLLARRAGEMYDGSPSLDFAVADLTLVSSPQRRFGVRAGRIKNPLGLYNETRDVPFTRPGIFLPQSVYYDKVRNLMLSSDGLMFYGESYGEIGHLSLTLGGGRAVIDENVEWAYLGDDFDGKLEAEGTSWVASLWYTTQTEDIKLGLSGFVSTMAFDPGANSVLGAGSIDFLDWIASFQYNAQDWTLSAEYSRVPLKWKDFGPFFPFHEETIEGYYLQGAYRLHANLELMLRYEEDFADRKDRDGSRSSALTGGITPPFDFYSKIWTLGMRWDINPSLMFRVEYQRHQGTFALSIRENPDPNALEEDWNVFAASISIRF